MCGIAGIIGTNEPAAVHKMLRATRHRGPNDTGTYISPEGSIGMNRLAIIDLSTAANQPMYDDSGRYIIVYNGELYNFKILREGLKAQGIPFYTQSDTEVILKSYLFFGKDCLDRFDGMFAFAIWDTQEHQLFAARDRVGIKPFYYSIQEGSLHFCSEIKGLLASGNIKKQFDKASVSLFLMTGSIPAPRTIIEGVEVLMPGHYMIWNKGAISIEAYWQLRAGTVEQGVEEETVIKEIKNRFVRAVESQLVSDVPLGVFLSGGLDSTVTTAAMKLNSSSTIESFSIGFQSSKAATDETVEAEITATHFNTKHHKLHIKDSDIPVHFEHFIEGLDQPSIDGLNAYLVAKYARENVTVALSGLGGDELFLGYGWQRSMLKHYNPYMPYLEGCVSLFDTLKNYMPSKLYGYGKRLLISGHFERLYATIGAVYSSSEVLALLSKDVHSATNPDKNIVTLYKSYNSAEDNAGLHQKITRIDMAKFMNTRLMEGDALSMVNSLEVRFPFLANEMVEYAWNLPLEMQIGKNASQANRDINANGVKRLLYRAFEKDLPTHFEKRTKKGFTLPMDTWLKTVFQQDLLTAANDSSLYNTAVTTGIVHGFLQGDETWPRAYAILILHRWKKRYLDA